MAHFIKDNETTELLDVLYFGVFDGKSYINETVILLARNVSINDGISMCQSHEQIKLNLDIARKGEDSKMTEILSTRYSVALTIDNSLFDVHIFIIDVRELEENKVMASIIGKQRIVFGAPRKSTNLVLFPYFTLHEHEGHQIFDIAGVRLVADGRTDIVLRHGMFHDVKVSGALTESKASVFGAKEPEIIS